MKPIKKNFAKLYIALIAIVLAVASVFCFVPMKWGSSFYHSFLGDIRFAGDLEGGYYAEYKIISGNTESKINNAAEDIYSVLATKGFTNVNVYNVENSTLRIEVGGPNGGAQAGEVMGLLQNIGAGKFEIRNNNSDNETTVILDGERYIKGVSVKNYNGEVMAYIEFNDAGITRFKEVVSTCSSSGIYLCLGDSQPQSISVSNLQTYDSLPLSFETVEAAESFKNQVIFGSMPIELDSNIVEINTMTSTIGTGKYIPNPHAQTFTWTLAKILALVALALVVVSSLVYMIVRFKVLGLLNLIAFLAEAIIMIFMLWAIPTIELSITGVFAIIAGVILININTLCYFGKIESERKLGKTITASIESAYSKSLPVNLISAATVAVLAGVMAIFTTGAVLVSCLILLISAILAIIMSIGFIPLLVNIFESFNKGKDKAYGRVGGKTNG